MKYLTKAGVKFLKEAYQNEEDDKKPKLNLSDLQNLRHPGQGIGKQTGNTNLSRNNPGHEKRMKAHQARIDAKVKLDIKMGRNET